MKAFWILLSMLIASGCGTTPATTYNYYLYLANQVSATVSAFTVNTTSGALTPISGTNTTGTTPQGIAADPSGKYVYVANLGSTTISGFSIAKTTGALTALSGSPFTGIAGNIGGVFDPGGSFFYVFGSGSIAAYPLTPTTGAFGTPITTTIANCLSGAMHPSGKFLMVETIVGGNTLNITPYTVNNGILTAGSAIAGGSLSAGSKPISTFDSTGSYYYVANSSNGTLYAYSVTSTTGALNLIASYTDASLTGLIGIAVDPSNKYVFVGGNIGGSTGGVATWTIGANGALTQANAFTAAGLMSLGVVFDPTGKFVYAADYGPSFNGTSIYAYSFNSSTGVPTALSPASYTTGTAPVVPIIVKVQQ